MEFLNFEASEFQVLEDIEFDETVQRPEKIRFYTLDEQIVDAFEKLVPRDKKVSKFQLEETKREVNRIKELYETFVLPTTEDYVLREPEFGRSFSWVFPVYATDERKEYNFGTSWMPLYDNVTLANFYPRMISALPRPYSESTEGIPYSITKPIEFLNTSGREPMRGLPMYEIVRTQRHEDKTIDILRVPVEGTSDNIHFVGYYLAKRSLDIPNPFPEHPFLKANEPTFIESTAALKDVIPSMDAVLTHGVPVTQNPYRDAVPYLKIYDIKLTDIPWSSWKSKFPQAEMIGEMPPVSDIDFPKPQEYKPSENIISTYKSEYSPGISSRLWLMDQDDGGELVVQMLLSKSIDNGSVESVPGLNIGQVAYPDTTIEECDLMGKSFQDFTVSGTLRRTGTKLQCVPLEFIKQERARFGYLNRTPWRESTANDILERHIRRLVQVRRVVMPPKKHVAEPKIPVRNESIRRREIIAIQDDPHRLTEDKLKDTQELLKETTLTANLYSDPEGLFVVCAHTLAILSGELAVDRLVFYDKWTAREDGFRVCKFCGEHINADVLEDQDEFDDSGHVVKHAESMEEAVFHGEAIANFTTGLMSLQNLFVMDNVVDATCYLLLSILQALPNAKHLDPILKLGREIAFKQFGNKDSDPLKKVKGALGIAITVVLLQTHVPSLVPRRSFGTKPLKLDGYPRDLPEPENYSIIDSLMTVLSKTFEAYPTSFKGPSAQVIRGIISKPSEVKNAVNVFLTKSLLPNPDIKNLFSIAKVYFQGLPPVEQPIMLIPVVMPPKEFDIITGYPECPSNRPILVVGALPVVSQRVAPLKPGLFPAKSKKVVTPTVSVRQTVAVIPKATIQARYKKKAPTKIPVRDGYRTNLDLASRLADIFQIPTTIRGVDPTQKADELRDIAQGYVYELLAAIQSDPVKRTKLDELRTKDVTLYMLLADFKEERTNVNKLRAQERLKFVDEMAKKSDQEREVIGELLKIGLAPYIITNRDREAFARQAEQLQEQVRVDDEEFKVDEEIGVGKAEDFFDQGEQPPQGIDGGDYGNYNAVPGNDGRDDYQPQFGDDEDTSI